MRFLDYLRPESIQLNVQAKTPKEAIRELVQLLAQANLIKEPEKVVASVMEREVSLSTGIGEGVAIPHGKINEVQEPIIAIGVTEEGIEWNAPDGRPVHLIILLISPLRDAGMQLRLLAAISRLIKKKGVAPILLNTDSPQNLLDYFKEMEGKRIL